MLKCKILSISWPYIDEQEPNINPCHVELKKRKDPTCLKRRLPLSQILGFDADSHGARTWYAGVGRGGIRGVVFSMLFRLWPTRCAWLSQDLTGRRTVGSIGTDSVWTFHRWRMFVDRLIPCGCIMLIRSHCNSSSFLNRLDHTSDFSYRDVNTR